MIDEIAGHLWWSSNGSDHSKFIVFLETDRGAYRCSQSENLWRQVVESPNPQTCEFAAPLGKRISKCLTGPEGCKYVLFSDGTAIRVFDPPVEKGWVKICSHAAAFLGKEDCARILQANESMPETPILRA